MITKSFLFYIYLMMFVLNWISFVFFFINLSMNEQANLRIILITFCTCLICIVLVYIIYLASDYIEKAARKWIVASIMLAVICLITTTCILVKIQDDIDT